MSYVLDSSFLGAFIMPDEKSTEVSAFFETIADDSVFHVPSLFWFEISNLLNSAIRRKRITPSDIQNLLNVLPHSKIFTDTTSGKEYTEHVTNLAVEYNLSSYDSAYLELAIRKDAQIGTLDENLSNACVKAGLKIIF